jgi:predicted nucleotidyltransferase
VITNEDKNTIREISRKYHANHVLLFGSSTLPDRESNDIDIAVDGIAPGDYYRFYGELMFALSKPVDVVDLAGTSKFIQIIRQDGVVLI